MSAPTEPAPATAKTEVIFGMEMPTRVIREVKQLALNEGITAAAWMADAAAEKLKRLGLHAVAAELADTGRKQRGRPPRDTS